MKISVPTTRIPLGKKKISSWELPGEAVHAGLVEGGAHTVIFNVSGLFLKAFTLAMFELNLLTTGARISANLYPVGVGSEVLKLSTN